MSKPGPTFLELSLMGYVELNDIDDYVDEWHESSDDRELREFLGLTPDEYKAWVEEPDLLPYIVTARKEGKEFSELIKTSFEEYRIAARSTNETGISAVEQWLKKNGKLD